MVLGCRTPWQPRLQLDFFFLFFFFQTAGRRCRRLCSAKIVYHLSEEEASQLKLNFEMAYLRTQSCKGTLRSSTVNIMENLNDRNSGVQIWRWGEGKSEHGKHAFLKYG